MSDIVQATSLQTEPAQLHWLSFFAFNGDANAEQVRETVSPGDITSLLDLAELHHVAIRTFEPLAASFAELIPELASRRERNRQTVARISQVCEALEQHGCPVMAIKSTDHWPDLGNDFDLFTTGDVNAVHRLMKKRFEADALPQSWGDRLANKWNYRVPGLTPLIEIHIGRLGQTGEFAAYGKELLSRRRRCKYGEIELWVPSFEDQLILSTLQRLYRHFFYRICDFLDTLALIEGALDIEQLRGIAKRHGIWQGVATHLRLVAEYGSHYRGAPIPIPAIVRKSSRFGIERLYPHASYFRLPLFPQGATLWGAQVVKTWKRHNRVGALRLGLLPPLAAAAGARYRVTGKQGIW